MRAWQPIESYPTEAVTPAEDLWGPDVVLRVPACGHFRHGPTFYVGRLEADYWLVRDPGNPCCWGELHCPPSHWQPLSEEAQP